MNPGTICYAKPDPTVGREHSGRRPVLVVSSTDFARHIPDLLIVVPLTTRDRGLRHHIRVEGDDTGLAEDRWALSEQVRAVPRSRLQRIVGTSNQMTVDAVRDTIAVFLDL